MPALPGRNLPRNIRQADIVEQLEHNGSAICLMAAAEIRRLRESLAKHIAELHFLRKEQDDLLHHRYEDRD